VATNLIQAGAMDWLGKSRGWMIANLEDHMKKLEYIEKCKERIQFYTENGKDKMKAQWEQKLKDTILADNAEEKYDIAKGEIEVLGMSFRKIPKVLRGVADVVQEFKDKNGNTMARVVFKTDYGEFKGLVFASRWKKKVCYDRVRGKIHGINIEQGKTYDFIMTKGVVNDVKLITNKLLTNDD
jgi:DNA polymerase-3 subunit alpha